MLDNNKSLTGSKKRNNHRFTITETPLNDNYMAVIRELHSSIMSRQDLKAGRLKILELDPEKDSRSWNSLKRKLQK